MRASVDVAHTGGSLDLVWLELVWGILWLITVSAWVIMWNGVWRRLPPCWEIDRTTFWRCAVFRRQAV